MTLNMRTHRKNLIVEGRRAFTGGLNIRLGHCRKRQPLTPVQDIHFSVQGPVVTQMQEVFTDDWLFTTGEALRGEYWFPAARFDYTIHEARAGAPLAEVVRRQLREGVRLVVAAGGDGTVSAVCDGLQGSTVPLGIIPAGTGNLVARELDIPLDPDAAVALLAGPHQDRRMDAMHIGERAYVLNISVGISAAIIDGTSRRSKRRLGRLAYFGTALRKVLLSRRWQIVVEVDGLSHPYRALDVAIMNGGLLGAQLYPRGPEIRIDDGSLGVWILSMKTPADYARYMFGVVAGRYSHPLAKFIRAARIVRIRGESLLPVQADGDIIGSTPIEVAVMPGAITVWVPVPRTESPSKSALSHSAVKKSV